MIVNFYTTFIYSIWNKHQNPLDATTSDYRYKYDGCHSVLFLKKNVKTLKNKIKVKITNKRYFSSRICYTRKFLYIIPLLAVFYEKVRFLYLLVPYPRLYFNTLNWLVHNKPYVLWCVYLWRCFYVYSDLSHNRLLFIGKSMLKGAQALRTL